MASPSRLPNRCSCDSTFPMPTHGRAQSSATVRQTHGGRPSSQDGISSRHAPRRSADGGGVRGRAGSSSEMVVSSANVSSYTRTVFDSGRTRSTLNTDTMIDASRYGQFIFNFHNTRISHLTCAHVLRLLALSGFPSAPCAYHHAAHTDTHVSSKLPTLIRGQQIATPPEAKTLECVRAAKLISWPFALGGPSPSARGTSRRARVSRRAYRRCR